MPPSAYLWILIALMSLISGAIILPLLRSGIPGVREAVWASVCICLGALAFLLQGRVPLLLGVLLPNTLVALSAAAFLASVRLLLGRPARWGCLGLAIAALLAVQAYYTAVEWSLSARVIASSIYLIGIILAAAEAVYVHARRVASLRYSHVFMIGLALALAFAHAVRIYVYGLGDSSGMEMLGDSGWHVGFLTMSVFSGPGLLIGLAMMFYDRRLSDREQEASTDFLTGLLLRRAWWSQTERQGSLQHRAGQPLLVILIDLDRFKRINDTHGHAAGDEVLCHFSRRLGGMLRRSDILGRLGGEEFVLALPGASQEQALELADRLRLTAAAEACVVDGKAIFYTFSAGVSAWEPGEPLSAAIARADKALYRAKEGGRNRVEAG